MDEVEKSRIQEDAKREAVGRGRHGSALRQYLIVSERREIKAGQANVPLPTARKGEAPRTDADTTDHQPAIPAPTRARSLLSVVRAVTERLRHSRR